MYIIRHSGKRKDLRLEDFNGGSLATVATTGSYTDLINRPTIPAAQIQSNWTQSNAGLLDYIKNKPNFATVATSGLYSDLSGKPTIPAAQIQSDWNQSNNGLLDYIKNKPTIPAAQIQSDWNQSNNSLPDFIKNKPSLLATPTSIPSAVTLGIVSGGSTDQTAAINTILSTYAGIYFDFQPSDYIYISGTINATGKILKFAPGTYLKFVGAGGINGGYIDASYTSQIFSGSGLVKPQGVISQYFSAMWFGAKGDGTTIDDATLQQAIDVCIYNGAIPMIFPVGQYKLSKGILFRKDAGGQNFVTPSNSVFLVGMEVFFEGGSYGQNTGGVRLINTNPNSFTIGLQRVKGFRSNGCSMIGVNTLPLTYNQYQIQQDPSSTFLNNGSLDTQGAAHSGLCLDPFGTPAATNKFPDFNSYYTEISSGGSTDVSMSNMWSQQFTVDYLLSPSGTQQNGEIISLTDCWGGYSKVSIATGNAQERTVIINNFHCWGGTYCVIDTRSYGNNSGCPPMINGLNIAGGNRYLCFLSSTISTGLIINNMHAELLWSLGGYIGGYSGKLTIRDSWIDLSGYISSYNLNPPRTVFNGSTLLMENTIFFEYDADVSNPLSIRASFAVFDKCSFQYIPINLAGQDSITNFRDCFIGGGFGEGTAIGWTQAPVMSGQTLLFTSGMKAIISGGNIKTRTKRNTNNIDEFSNPIYRDIVPVLISTPVTLASATSTTAVFTLGASSVDYKNLVLGDKLFYFATDEFGFSSFCYFGTVQTLSSGTVTLNGVGYGLNTSTAYDLYIYRNEYYIPYVIVGDTVSGSNVISNVVREGASDPGHQIGIPIYIRHFPKGTTITAWNLSTSELTVSNNANFTESNVAIVSSDWVSEETGLLPSLTSPYEYGFKRGDVVWNTDTITYPSVIKWICTQSGVTGTSKQPVFITYP